MTEPESRFGRVTAPGLVSQARRRFQVARPTPAATAPHLIVCGDDPLTYRLVDELAVRYGRQVTVILRSKRRNHGPEIAKIRGVRVIEAERLDAEAFGRAEVSRARTLALVAQDDVANLHAALQAQEINPEVRLVIRMFNMSLGHSIRKLFRNCLVLSDASIAAPAVVAAALGEVEPSFVPLPGRTLFVARRAEVASGRVVCGLADTTGRTPVLLPTDQSRCDLVLAVADGGGPPRLAVGRAGRWWRRWSLFWRQLIGLVSGTLRIALLILVGVMLVGTGALIVVNGHLTTWQAFYLTILDAVGGANPNPDGSGPEQALQVVVMLAGLAMVPVITAAVVETVVNAKLALALGRRRGPIADHVIVIGLGNVGTRVIQRLHDLGVPVVAIDKNDHARGTQLARELRIPLIIGDASRVETLHEASVETARSLAVVSTDDTTNLEAALHARTLKEDLRVVLRLFDGDFAARAQSAFGISASASVSLLAVPAFTAAILEREVIGTIAVDRRVLAVAEVPVKPGSALDGGTAGEAAHDGEARVIAVTTSGEYRDLCWVTEPGHPLRAGDRLIVVATRHGLGLIQTRATAAQQPAEPAAPAG